VSQKPEQSVTAVQTSVSAEIPTKHEEVIFWDVTQLRQTGMNNSEECAVCIFIYYPEDGGIRSC
jgi:hypothetical protein